MDEDRKAYELEDCVNSVEALMQDVQRGLTRAALKQAVTRDTRRHMAMKLRDAAKRIEQLPLYEGE